jgi:hypothetical protein
MWCQIIIIIIIIIIKVIALGRRVSYYSLGLKG